MTNRVSKQVLDMNLAKLSKYHAQKSRESLFILWLKAKHILISLQIDEIFALI